MYAPPGHETQELEPERDATVPAGQVVHEVASASEYVPAGQASQAVVPPVAAVPASQAAHSVEPTTPE